MKARATARPAATRASRAKPTSVAAYIQAAPDAAREKLRQMRVCVRAAAPGAKEEIKWGMPAYSYGRILVMFAAFRAHIGFFPTGSVTRAFAKELSGFHTGKGSIRFPLDQPLPRALIRRITARRVRDNAATDVKWRS